MTYILVSIWEKFAESVPTTFCEKGKTLCQFLVAFSQSTQNFPHFERKYKFNSLINLEFIDSDKCGYLNAREFPFYNTLVEATWWQVLNTAEVTMAAILS